MKHPSLFSRLFFAVSAVFIVYAYLLSYTLALENSVGFYTSILTVIALTILAWLFKLILTPINKALSAVENGISSFNDNDFSLTIHNQNFLETYKIVNIYNELATALRDERMDIFQRELLLDTVMQSTPVALVLTNTSDNIVYSNIAAKELFKQTKKLDGFSFSSLLPMVSKTLQTTTKNKTSGLINDIQNDQTIIYHVDCRQFMLNGSEHSLYLYKNMTSEISRKETDMWKQAIRLISHELNNSLAPISSLTRSAQKIIHQPEHLHMLNDVLDTIGKRTEHLHNFISDYAQFARFPKPVMNTVNLKAFFNNIATLVDIHCHYDVISSEATFDAGQIEQVLINLVKNAQESGSQKADIGFYLTQQANLLTFTVIDGGNGLSEKQMEHVLLPFFTTKTGGTGIGLALCNEIINRHHSKLLLTNRKAGGLNVSFSLDLSVGRTKSE